jgi:nicotinate-nucleotide--dimethylbenzimidazole phosphoribosyltransferase
MKIIEQIRAVDKKWIDLAAKNQLQLTKPPGSLGRLEEIANRCVAIKESLSITANRPRIVLFAADHGVCEEGVSMYPQEVTLQMVQNFLHGGAAINSFARSLSIDLKVVDVGVATEPPVSSDLINRRISPGTRNFCRCQAISLDEMDDALDAGVGMARDAAAAGCDLLGFGEMGIGNTTAASAIAAALTGKPVDSVVGRGTGADEECMVRKRSAVKRGLKVNAARLKSPTGILQSFGGFEIAAMCGFCLGAAAYRVPVVMDGFIATAAAALAVRMCPAVSDYLFAAHRSAEPGHAHLLSMMGQEPLLDLGMRLGEGTGAALAMKIMQASVAAFMGMATFASAGVSNQ